MIRKTYLLACLLVSALCSFGQTKHDLSWEELQEQYELPQWYTDARFGIWATIGPQSQPRLGGGWYARHMFMEDVQGQTFGRNAYSYHKKTYGPQSQLGYTEVIRQWKAEHLDTDALVKYFKGLGAKYIIVHANHHDHFDNFASSHHPWNSVNMGPKKDIVGLFEKSVRKYGLPFGVSSHDDRFLGWWLPAFGSDKEGPYKGIPYEGRMTKADGKGKWWEGYDPAQLYGLPPEQRTPEYEEALKKNYLERHKELVTKYNIDLLWVDGYGFPYGKYGKEVFRTLFNNSLDRHGKTNAVGIAKVEKEPMLVRDIEAGVANEILPYPWDGIFTFTHWFYKEDDALMHNARTVIELTSDIISKNGNMLLNVELMGDGTLAPAHKGILDDVGRWMAVNGKAVYASRPWKIYGDNLNSCLREKERNIVNADMANVLKEAQDENFNARTVASTPYGPDEVRFTVCNGKLYIFVLHPATGTIELPSLGLGSAQQPGKISSIKMLGGRGKVHFRQDADKLVLEVPEERPTPYTVVFEVKGDKCFR
ncbi:alpha-L-fucosidase [Phocaeicola sp.]